MDKMQRSVLSPVKNSQDTNPVLIRLCLHHCTRTPYEILALDFKRMKNAASELWYWEVIISREKRDENLRRNAVIVPDEKATVPASRSGRNTLSKQPGVHSTCILKIARMDHSTLI